MDSATLTRRETCPHFTGRTLKHSKNYLASHFVVCFFTLFLWCFNFIVLCMLFSFSFMHLIGKVWGHGPLFLNRVKSKVMYLCIYKLAELALFQCYILKCKLFLLQDVKVIKNTLFCLVCQLICSLHLLVSSTKMVCILNIGILITKHLCECQKKFLCVQIYKII